MCILFCILAPLQSSIWLNWASLIDFDPASKAYQIFIIIEALSHFPTKPNTEFKPKCYISKIWLHQLIRYTENEKFNYGSERICINWLNDDTASSSRWHFLTPVIKVCCDKLKLYPNCHDLPHHARIKDKKITLTGPKLSGLCFLMMLIVICMRIWYNIFRECLNLSSTLPAQNKLFKIPNIHPKYKIGHQNDEICHLKIQNMKFSGLASSCQDSAARTYFILSSIIWLFILPPWWGWFFL